MALIEVGNTQTSTNVIPGNRYTGGTWCGRVLSHVVTDIVVRGNRDFVSHGHVLQVSL